MGLPAREELAESLILRRVVVIGDAASDITADDLSRWTTTLQASRSGAYQLVAPEATREALEEAGFDLGDLASDLSSAIRAQTDQVSFVAAMSPTLRVKGLDWGPEGPAAPGRADLTKYDLAVERLWKEMKTVPANTMTLRVERFVTLVSKYLRNLEAPIS